MQRFFRTAVGEIRNGLFWLPHWLAGIVVLILVAGIALGVHALLLRLARRGRLKQSQFWRQFTMRAANPTRFLIVLIAVAAAIPASGLPSSVQRSLISPLSAVFVLLLGWCAIATVGLTGDLYLARLSTDYGNAMTRKHVTQVRLLRRAGQILIVLLTIGGAMMVVPAIRQYGVSLFASAGAAGIVVGLAARPLLSNLLAGIQIAITQPVKIEDSVVINNEWGWIEDITSTYLVLRTWDLRRLIIPLSWFLEQPIQNWTRENATIIGQVHLNVDYRTPVEELRKELDREVHASKLWDRNVVNLQVVEADAETIQLRILATASDASKAWDLRCELREKMIAYIAEHYPQYLPHRRVVLEADGRGEPSPNRTKEWPAERQQRQLRGV